MLNIITSDAHPITSKFFQKIPNTYWKIIPQKDFSTYLKNNNLGDFDLILYQEQGTFVDTLHINKPKILLCMTLPEERLSHNFNTLSKHEHLKYLVFISPQQIWEWKVNFNNKIKLISWVIDVDEYPKWTGGQNEVISICNLLKQRDMFCGYFVWENCTKNLPRKLIGFGNEEIGNESDGIMGYKTPEEIKTFLQSCNVFFNQTTKSTTPTSLLQAMAVGIPIVSYESYFANQVIGYRGYVNNNLTHLNKKLKELISNTPNEYIEYGQRNRNFVKETFSPELWVYNWERIFKQSFLKK